MQSRLLTLNLAGSLDLEMDFGPELSRSRKPETQRKGPAKQTRCRRCAVIGWSAALTLFPPVLNAAGTIQAHYAPNLLAPALECPVSSLSPHSLSG